MIIFLHHLVCRQQQQHRTVPSLPPVAESLRLRFEVLLIATSASEGGTLFSKEESIPFPVYISTRWGMRKKESCMAAPHFPFSFPLPRPSHEGSVHSRRKKSKPDSKNTNDTSPFPPSPCPRTVEMRWSVLTLALLGVLAATCAVNAQYQPNWPSLMTRPLPQWFDDAKVIAEEGASYNGCEFVSVGWCGMGF